MTRVLLGAGALAGWLALGTLPACWPALAVLTYLAIRR